MANKKYIINGKIFEDDEEGKKFIINGKIYESNPAPAGGEASIMNQIQTSNLGADLFNGTIQ